MGDTGAQISQYFQLPNGTSNYLNLISDTQLINNHHPVLHTVLMGTAVKIGRMLGSDNLGIFLYTLFQYLCMAAALAYGISYLKNLKMPRWFQGGILGLTALYPVFPRYAVLLSKDTLFSSCVLVFEIFLIRLVREEIKISKKEGILFLLTMLGVMMLRQNGLYVVVFFAACSAFGEGQEEEEENSSAVLRSDRIVLVIYPYPFSGAGYYTWKQKGNAFCSVPADSQICA